jgi:hypothetical protein
MVGHGDIALPASWIDRPCDSGFLILERSFGEERPGEEDSQSSDQAGHPPLSYGAPWRVSTKLVIRMNSELDSEQV